MQAGMLWMATAGRVACKGEVGRQGSGLPARVPALRKLSGRRAPTRRPLRSWGFKYSGCPPSHRALPPGCTRRWAARRLPPRRCGLPQWRGRPGPGPGERRSLTQHARVAPPQSSPGPSAAAICEEGAHGWVGACAGHGLCWPGAGGGSAATARQRGTQGRAQGLAPAPCVLLWARSPGDRATWCANCTGNQLPVHPAASQGPARSAASQASVHRVHSAGRLQGCSCPCLCLQSRDVRQEAGGRPWLPAERVPAWLGVPLAARSGVSTEMGTSKASGTQCSQMGNVWRTPIPLRQLPPTAC